MDLIKDPRLKMGSSDLRQCKKLELGLHLMKLICMRHRICSLFRNLVLDLWLEKIFVSHQIDIFGHENQADQKRKIVWVEFTVIILHLLMKIK